MNLKTIILTLGLSFSPFFSYAVERREDVNQITLNLEQLASMALHCGRKSTKLIPDSAGAYRKVDIYTLESGDTQVNFLDGKQSTPNGKVDPSDYVSIIRRGRFQGASLDSPVWNDLPRNYQRLIQGAKENMSQICSPGFKCC